MALCISARSGASLTAGASACSQSVVGAPSFVVVGEASMAVRMRLILEATAQPFSQANQPQPHEQASGRASGLGQGLGQGLD